jgi:hypothetical protein
VFHGIGLKLILQDAVVCFTDMFRLLFGEALCKDAIWDNLHAAYLLIDEMCQDG